MFKKHEIVKVRMVGEVPDHWSEPMEALRGKIIEVFSINAERRTVAAGQHENTMYIWEMSDIEKFLFQPGRTVKINPYKIDEGHFAKQNINLSNLTGRRFEIIDVKPFFNPPIAIKVKDEKIWVYETDLDPYSVQNGNSSIPDPNICFLSKKMDEMYKMSKSSFDGAEEALTNSTHVIKKMIRVARKKKKTSTGSFLFETPTASSSTTETTPTGWESSTSYTWTGANSERDDEDIPF